MDSYEVEAGGSTQKKLEAPESRDGFYRDIVVLAYPCIMASNCRPEATELRSADLFVTCEKSSVR